MLSLWSLFFGSWLGERTVVKYIFSELGKSEYGIDIRCYYVLVVILLSLVMVFWLCEKGPFFPLRNVC